ncbi:MAG: hypothetical protein HQK77_04895 [Desulfobacterales bacterium]|nr:hypothetical protein [Desulfobacterales bacterium]
MSPDVITKRLNIVNQLRRICLSLADSSAGKKIRKHYVENKTVQRTSLAIGHTRKK